VQTCTGTGDWGNSVACLVTNGTPSCTGNGVCGIASCSAGYADCSGGVTDGCETNLHIASSCGTTCANHPACSMSNGTPSCPNGSCMMACNAGFGDCSQTTNDGCETNLNVAANCGTCAHTVQCTVPAQICSAGSCVTNTPYNLGQSAQSGGTYAPPADQWNVYQITAPKNATVTSFQIVAEATGGLARMAIWADDGAGHPGAFLGQSPNISLNVSAGNGVDGGAVSPKAPATSVTLNAGQKYWVGSKFSGAANIYQNAVAGASLITIAQTFGTAPAVFDTFPSGYGTIGGVALSFYLVVQDIPQ
jgi:hypothetical protein